MADSVFERRARRLMWGLVAGDFSAVSETLHQDVTCRLVFDESHATRLTSRDLVVVGMEPWMGLTINRRLEEDTGRMQTLATQPHVVLAAVFWFFGTYAEEPAQGAAVIVQLAGMLQFDSLGLITDLQLEQAVRHVK